MATAYTKAKAEWFLKCVSAPVPKVVDTISCMNKFQA